MDSADHLVASMEEVPSAWGTLDDALQILVRADSLVMLLQCAFDLEEHHRHGASVACDLLRSLKEKLAEAQAQIRPGP